MNSGTASQMLRGAKARDCAGAAASIRLTDVEAPQILRDWLEEKLLYRWLAGRELPQKRLKR